MTAPSTDGRAAGRVPRTIGAIGARVPPLILVVVGSYLTVVFGRSLLDTARTTAVPWWGSLFLMLMAIAMLALAGAVTIDPRPLLLRRALAGAALAWLVILVGIAAIWNAVRLMDDALAILPLVVAVGLGLIGIVAINGDVSSPDEDAEPLEGVGAVLLFAGALIGAAVALVISASLVGRLWRLVAGADPLDRLPWGAFVLILVLPPLTFALASVLSRRAGEGTFQAQADANRRNSLLLVVALVGILAATTEIIAVSLTGDPVPAILAAGAAMLAGFGAVIYADRLGSSAILDSAGARPADPKRDTELLDVVQELAVSADIPVPAVYVVEDGSQNAFATGRDPEHASVVVTRGLLQRMDREEVQGVIGHELGHIRNLDIRFALYIAILVGLVALVTDGFLRMVIEAWRRGAFYWRGSGKSAAGALVTGLLVGLFLLIVAALLRLVAPLFSALVQAASSREREFLADATSVEFTRNPRALERALTSLASDTDTLDAANRGTQHLWFRNPVKPGSDRRPGILATHPSLAARIDRLRVLEGLGPLDPSEEQATADET